LADDHPNQDGPITVARAFERQQLRNRLRVAHIRDNALIEGRAADPVDVDHVPPGLKPAIVSCAVSADAKPAGAAITRTHPQPLRRAPILYA
jgi:hypothetical protein